MQPQVASVSSPNVQGTQFSLINLLIHFMETTIKNERCGIHNVQNVLHMNQTFLLLLMIRTVVSGVYFSLIFITSMILNSPPLSCPRSPGNWLFNLCLLLTRSKSFPTFLLVVFTRFFSTCIQDHIHMTSCEEDMHYLQNLHTLGA